MHGKDREHGAGNHNEPEREYLQGDAGVSEEAGKGKGLAI